jgi:alkylhydroperoxidase family enzyme
VAQDGDDRLSRAVLADPRAVAARWPDPRHRMLAELAVLVTETPWLLSPAIRERARAAGLDDETQLHAIALAAYFNHLNRIADAVAVPLDYAVRHMPPHAEAATPALAPAPRPVAGAPALPLTHRPATHAALAAWSDYIMAKPDAARIRARVARLLGDGSLADDLPADVAALVDQVTLAPWQLGDASYAALRAVGLDDRALFDIVAIASSVGVTARINVALAALA